MSYQQLIILLPCHSLEDFPTSLEGEEAHGLLAGWTALWHPALVASAQAMPTWFRADTPPQDVSNRLLVIPGVSQAKLPTGFVQRAEREAKCAICNKLDRHEIIATALNALGDAMPAVDESLAADFLALGYCYLQVQLLTRQLRYSSNLDEIHFQKQVVAAATAIVQGDLAETRTRLQAGFDLLAAEREHYYPVEPFVLDITMVAATTLGEPLRRQLASGAPTNLVLSGERLSLLAEREPETLAMLRQAVDEGRVGLIGGELSERRLPLVSGEAILAQFKAGLARYEAILGKRPVIFGRQAFGITPFLPQVLHKLGFEAGIHACFDAGVYPDGSQTKVRWEGCDGTSLDVIAKPPADAAKPRTFLNYGVKMGESMDMDHVASISLAHWAGAACPWYEDLRRIAQYCPALGRFATVDHYFRKTDHPAHQDRFGVDQYRSPYLRQAVAANRVDPISSVVRYWRRRAAAEAAQALDTLATLASGKTRIAADEVGVPRADQLLAELDLREDVDADADRLDGSLTAALDRSIERLSATLPRVAAPPQTGYLLVNPHSFVRRVGFAADSLESLPAIERPVYSACSAGAAKYVVADVPPMGFAWVAPESTRSRDKKPPLDLVDEHVLRNEFFEAMVDPVTGALRSFHEYQARGNRLSQQLAFRLGDPKHSKAGEMLEDAEYAKYYSIMAADSVQTTVCTPTLGEIAVAGRLMDRQGKVLATYRQTFRVWRGNRVLQIDIELEPQVECKPDPWSSYFAARFAWASESAEVFRAVNQTRHTTTARRFESPHYVDIDDGANRTTILTGGLPFHLRQGRRMLDTLLIVHGERCGKFQIGIGLDVKQPMQEALNLLAPPTLVCQSAAPPSPSASGWLFHLDCRTVTATHWEPLLEDGRVAGFRVRLLETAGRSVKAGLSTFRPVRSARRMKFQGDALGDCLIADGKVEIHLAAHEWSEVEARW